MKYCKYCGAQMVDEAVFCVKCGCSAEEVVTTKKNTDNSTLTTVAKVFMIIGCVLSAFYFLIPLCWTIPMTVHYCNAVSAKNPVGVGFKVCSLLFVSTIAGILMLCTKDDN